MDEWDEHKARVLERIAPAEVAAAIVNDANRDTAQMVVNDELRKRKDRWGV